MISLENVVKTYHTGRGDVKALDGVNLRIEEGEFVVICGPSGSGKTTLLLTIAGMLQPTSGIVTIEQNNLYDMSVMARTKFRAENIGFIFQMFHLVPYLNIAENIVLAGGPAANKSRKANELMEKFGLAKRSYHKPSELSVGEKQRTAIARALLNRPKILLADEIASNLDPDNTATVIGYLSEFHHNGGTVIMATHGPQPEKPVERTIHLRNGRIGSYG